MPEHMKDLAKRFYVLLYIFLKRRYKNVEVVFIRHTHLAQEVDEDTFFNSPETGGTVVSTALEEMQRVVAERFSPDNWNIYAAQASDGDNTASDFQIGIVLARRQNRVGQQVRRALIVGRRVVTVGGLRGIDIPIVGTETFRNDALHFLKRGGDHCAAGFRAVEERVLVHLLRQMSMADEHDLDVLVTTLQEEVQQHVKPFGKVLHVLGHRTGDVHQAEHHRLGDRLGMRLEPLVAHVKRVDVGDQAGAAKLALQFCLQHL